MSKTKGTNYDDEELNQSFTIARYIPVNEIVDLVKKYSSILIPSFILGDQDEIIEEIDKPKQIKELQHIIENNYQPLPNTEVDGNKELAKFDKLTLKEGFKVKLDQASFIKYGQEEDNQIIVAIDNKGRVCIEENSNYTGVVTVERRDEHNNLIKDSKDIIFFKNGVVIGFTEGIKGESRLMQDFTKMFKNFSEKNVGKGVEVYQENDRGEDLTDIVSIHADERENNSQKAQQAELIKAAEPIKIEVEELQKTVVKSTEGDPRKQGMDAVLLEMAKNNFKPVKRNEEPKNMVVQIAKTVLDTENDLQEKLKQAAKGVANAVADLVKVAKTATDSGQSKLTMQEEGTVTPPSIPVSNKKNDKQLPDL